jgi:O-antigen ligase
MRKRIKATLSADKPLTYAIASLFVAFALSIPTSITPLESVKNFINIPLDLLFPFFACAFVMDSERRQEKFLRILILCAIFATMLACVEYRLQQRWFVHLMSQSVIDKDPRFAATMLENSYRDGRYRASAHFLVPLSFGEYCSLMLPVGLFFLAYAKNFRDRMLGFCGIFAMLIGVYIANARGGVIGVLMGSAAFVLLYTIKAVVRDKSSLIGAWLVSLLPVIFSIIPAMMLVSHTFTVMITGGAEAQDSNDDRFIQWSLAWPKILQRPITGWGLGNSGTVVGFKSSGAAGLSVDSYPLTLITDAGVLGLIAFYSILGVILWRGVNLYLRNSNQASTKAIIIVSTFVAFLVQRTTLSQTENFINIFLFMGFFLGLEKFVASQSAVTIAETNSGVDIRKIEA